MPQMTKGQKVVLVLGALSTVTMFVFPPFISGGDLIPTVDFALLWQPPPIDPGYGIPTVYSSFWAGEFIVFAVLILIALVILRPDPDDARKIKAHWKMLLWNLSSIPIQIRIKYKDADQVVEGALSPTAAGIAEGPVGPIRVLSLEWLEIDPIQRVHCGALIAPGMIDHTTEVEAVLKSLNVSYEWNEDWMRITGHVRNE